MRALGRSRASGDTDGFVKILADKTTDEVLGVHMVGARVADLIAEGVTAMEFRASAEDIARMSHAHPTYAEGCKRSSASCYGRQSVTRVITVTYYRVLKNLLVIAGFFFGLWVITLLRKYHENYR